MTEVLQVIVNGIMAGSIYGLIAAGLALLFGTLHIPQFAIGAHAMLGAYVVYFVTTYTGLPYGVAILVAALAIGALGVIVQVLVFAPLRNAPPVNMFIAAFGLMLVLQSLAELFFGSSYRKIDSGLDGPTSIGGVRLTEQRLLVIVAAALIAVALFWFIYRTTTGMSLRALADNPRGALVIGLLPKRLALVAGGVASALAGVAGGLLAPIAQVFPTLGDLLVIKAFVIIILAGMGKVLGALAGGYLLGIVESLGGAYVTATYQEVLPFVVLVLVLALRPQGIFQRKAA